MSAVQGRSRGLPICLALAERLALPPGVVPAGTEAALTAITACAKHLRRPVCVVAVFGVFKAGKSTVLNALLGADVVPMRANRATGVVTSVSYAPEPSAWVEFDTGGPRTRARRVRPEEVHSHILIDLESDTTLGDVQRVEIGLPVEVLRRGSFTLLDTPGLRDSPELTERCRDAIASADLGVMVLDATQALSQDDRAEAERIQALLGGSLVFLLNRIGLLEPEERASVARLVASGVRGVGNAAVGKGRVFACDALAALKARKAGEAPVKDGAGGLVAFEEWLLNLSESGRLADGATYARLGTLLTRLADAEAVLGEHASQFGAEASRLAELQAKQQAEARRKRDLEVAKARSALTFLRSELDGLAGTFRGELGSSIRSALASAQWQSSGPITTDAAAKSFAEKVEKACQAAVKNLVPASRCPTFEPECAALAFSAPGGGAEVAGAAAGATIGSFVLPGVGTIIGAFLGGAVGGGIADDRRKRTVQASLEAAAEARRAALLTAADAHIRHIEAMLRQAAAEAMPAVTAEAAWNATIAMLKRCGELLDWCREIRCTAELALCELDRGAAGERAQAASRRNVR